MIPDGELIFSEHFHSITDHIFHFKSRLWFSGLWNRTIDSDIKVLNHVLLMLASDLDKQKSKTFKQNFSLKMNRLNSLIIKLVCFMQHRRKYQAKKVMKFQVLKVESANSKIFESQFSLISLRLGFRRNFGSVSTS